MEIINVIEIVKGVLSSVESFPIDNELAKSNSTFFTEKEAVEKAEAMFLAKAKENGLDKEINIEDYKQDDDFPHSYLKDVEINETAVLDNGNYDDNNGYEVLIHWSAINVNE